MYILVRVVGYFHRLPPYHIVILFRIWEPLCGFVLLFTLFHMADATIQMIFRFGLTLGYAAPKVATLPMEITSVLLKLKQFRVKG